MERYDVLGTYVNSLKKEDAVSFLFNNFNTSKNNYICCANAHTVVYGYENNEYKRILNNSFITLPDGAPIAKAGEKLGLNTEKISGVDFLEEILKTDCTHNHFFYGNTKENIEKFINNVEATYKNLHICGYEESKFRELTTEEKFSLKDKIINSKADIVWVGLGAPKQEIFCAEMCKESDACWIAVGGAFNVVANIIPRAPKWMQKYSLEWFYRFTKEPKRLFKRYFIGNIKYIWYNILYKWKKKN